MALKYEAKVKSGTYKNQNGEEKTNWIKIGAVFETEKGVSMKMESVPVSWDGWISFFEPRPKDDKKPQIDSGITDDSIPF
jgi:hypothetical protein